MAPSLPVDETNHSDAKVDVAASASVAKRPFSVSGVCTGFSGCELLKRTTPV
jgi:hypothetical protein